MFILNYETLIDPLLKEVRKSVPEFTGMKAGDRVLDVCCGTGAQVIEYGQRGINAVGIDINPRMLSVARRKIEKHKAANIDFYMADAVNLPFPDNCFDFASVSLALHDKPRPVRRQIISEMKRVIKPDGNLVFIDFQIPLPDNFWSYVIKTIEFLARGSHHESFKDYLASDGLQGILHSWGLQEERRIIVNAGLIVIIKVPNI